MSSAANWIERAFEVFKPGARAISELGTEERAVSRTLSDFKVAHAGNPGAAISDLGAVRRAFRFNSEFNFEGFSGAGLRNSLESSLSNSFAGLDGTLSQAEKGSRDAFIGQLAKDMRAHPEAYGAKGHEKQLDQFVKATGGTAPSAPASSADSVTQRAAQAARERRQAEISGASKPQRQRQPEQLAQANAGGPTEEPKYIEVDGKKHPVNEAAIRLEAERAARAAAGPPEVHDAEFEPIQSTAPAPVREPETTHPEWENVSREPPPEAAAGGGGSREPPREPPPREEPPREPPPQPTTPQQPAMMSMGGNRGPSPATQRALDDHEKFKGFAGDRLGAFGEANKLFESGSSQDLVHKFSQLDEMLGAFNIKQMGDPGAAKVDALGNLENPEVLFAAMIPDLRVKPKGAPISLVATSKADSSSVNGKILSYYDNAGEPIKPIINTDRATPNDVNRVLQQLLAYKPGQETHIHPADWEKVRGAVYERRFNELSDKLAGGQQLDATLGSGADGKGSELDDYVAAARITGRVEANSTRAPGSISEIVARSRGADGRISEADIGAIRRSHTAARAAENNPTSNLVRDIVDTLKPTTKEVTDVQTEMATLRRNVRASGMLDTTPVDPDAPVRSVEEIKDALRNGEQVKSPELERYIKKQIGDSLESSQRSLVATLQAGFNSNKRMDTEQIFSQLEKIRKDPDYPLRDSAVDAKGARGKTASPKDVNERLFAGRAISDGELTVLRSFYKRFFDAASAPADTAGGGGMGIRALQVAQSITDGVKDAKSAPALSVSRQVQYSTGVVIPSIRKTVVPVAGAVTLAALAQAAVDPEHPNFVGRASINFVYPDGNNNKADDFAEFIYNRMNADTGKARKDFKEYLGIDLPQDASKGDAKTAAQIDADKNIYKTAIQKIRDSSFIKEPTADLRNALMMYASVKATGKASSSSAEVQTELNSNIAAEAAKAQADVDKAGATATLSSPTDLNYSFSSAPAAGPSSLSQDFKNASQFEASVSQISGAIQLNVSQISQVKAAWAKVAGDGKMEEKDRPTFEQTLKNIGLDEIQTSAVATAAFSPAPAPS